MVDRRFLLSTENPRASVLEPPQQSKKRAVNTRPTLDPSQPSREKMKIMAKDSSATVRSETPHLSATIKRRAQDLINNKSIDAATRNVLRYGSEIDDPLLPKLVRRIDAGKPIIDDEGFLQMEK